MLKSLFIGVGGLLLAVWKFTGITPIDIALAIIEISQLFVAGL